ncbi:L-asparagine oxygenase [Marinomonas spartinae]|nr:TauD/TfdA family dioxygenase [Marinomonas spartinae]SBS39216.1 L-asparagine oxygenase [Marinomonas spartinae]
MAFHPQKTDYVILLCLRQDHNKEAETFISSAKEIRSQLSKEDIQTLCQPLFRTGVDYSFGSPNNTKGNGPTLKILDEEIDDFICYDLDLMVGLTETARKSLYNLRLAANRCKYSIKLEKGDLLVIDNNKVIHGRSEFNPLYDGYDRWILRTCAMQSINSFRNAVNLKSPRKIETTFEV